MIKKFTFKNDNSKYFKEYRIWYKKIRINSKINRIN